MRAVVQRVTSASVSVDGSIVGSIATGLLVLVGVTHDDGQAQADTMARKLHELRILRDDQSCASSGAPLLVVSQFTLIADSKRQKGTRPDFSKAAPRQEAEPLYEHFCSALRDHGVPVETGVFGAYMAVELVNDGPVTIVLDA